MRKLRPEGTIRQKPQIPPRTLLEMAHQLVPRLEILHEIPARGQKGRNEDPLQYVEKHPILEFFYHEEHEDKISALLIINSRLFVFTWPA
jgi:hypothetical protein